MAHQYGTCTRPCQLCAGTAAHAALRGPVRPLGGDQVTPRSQAVARRLGSAGTVLPNHLLRHICRNIQYHWIFRQHTVHLCPLRPPADGQREDAVRPRRIRMEPAHVSVNCVQGPRPKRDSTLLI
jgi:hypothetical protein